MSTETKPRTNQEFTMELLVAALDFNSQIVTRATAELAGEPSSKNKTHQKQVVSELQMLGSNYVGKLNNMFDRREQELRGDDAVAGFSKDDAGAIRRVMGILDQIMESSPNRETADAHNYLEMVLRTSDEPKEGSLKDELEKGKK